MRSPEADLRTELDVRFSFRTLAKRPFNADRSPKRGFLRFFRNQGSCFTPPQLDYKWHKPANTANECNSVTDAASVGALIFGVARSEALRRAWPSSNTPFAKPQSVPPVLSKTPKRSGQWSQATKLPQNGLRDRAKLYKLRDFPQQNNSADRISGKAILR